MAATVLLSTAYLPPVQYFSKLLSADKVIIEKFEFFEKQSYRNRCTIYGANGKLNLMVPLEHGTEKTLVSEKKISYVHPWRNLHWKSICSAYRSSPYFEYFEKEFEAVYKKKHEKLFDLNTELLLLILKLLRKEIAIEYTSSYQKSYEGITDLRALIHPKKDAATDPHFQIQEYYQVFGNKNGFLSNLSVVDLLFNEGLRSLEILKSSAV